MHKRMKEKGKLEAYMMGEAGECIDAWKKVLGKGWQMVRS